MGSLTFENINNLSDVFRLEMNHFIVVDLIVCFANWQTNKKSGLFG